MIKFNKDRFRPIINQFFIVSLLLLPLVLSAQQEPSWMKHMDRTEQYPNQVFITGFAQDGKNSNETAAEAQERVKDMARANLTKSIISSVKSVSQNYIQSLTTNGHEDFTESFESKTETTTDIQINGVKVESHVGNNQIISAFAHANKYEIIGYYKANLNMHITQIEGFIKTGADLETKKEKVKAKNEFNNSLPLFKQVKEAQGILSALDKTIDQDGLKMEHTMNLYNEVIQANARLSQGIFVYISSNEDVFGENYSAIENNLKAFLSENGCSFIENSEKADWRIIIEASAREYNLSNGIYFSYVDATVQLFKASTNKNVYQNEFSQKGTHNQSYNFAAKNAYKSISKPISDKIINWIAN